MLVSGQQPFMHTSLAPFWCCSVQEAGFEYVPQGCSSNELAQSQQHIGVHACVCHTGCGLAACGQGAGHPEM